MVGQARRCTTLALTVLLLDGCCLGSAATPWTPIDALPTSLERAHTLATERGLEIDVEPIREIGHGGGGGSCHSAACLILLPVILAASLVPERVSDAVTLRSGGTDVMLGVYAIDGTLVRGRLRRAADDGSEHWLESERLWLPRLGVDRSMDVARVAILPLGIDGPREEIALGPQLPEVVERLRTTLAESETEEARVELLAEALARVPGVVREVALEHAATASDSEAAAIIARACGGAAAEVGAEIAAARSDEASLLAVSGCLIREQSVPGAQLLSPRLCDPRTDLAPLAALVGHRGWDHDYPPLRELCTGPRGTALTFLARSDVPAAQVIEALSAECSLAAYALSADRPQHLRAGIEVLGRSDAACAERVAIALSSSVRGRALLEPGHAAQLCDAIVAHAEGHPVLTAETLWLLRENEVPADAAARVAGAARAHPDSLELASAALALRDASFAPRVAPHVRDRESPWGRSGTPEEHGAALADYAIGHVCTDPAEYLRRPRGPCELLPNHPVPARPLPP